MSAMKPLIPLDDARQALFDQLSVIAEVETLALNDAAGRILAESVVASINVPPRANSAMDGYALAAKDAIAGAELAISQRIPAGAVTTPLDSGTAARIFTGAELPDGADCVVMQENTELCDKGVRILQTAKAAENVRAAGLDITAGEVIVEAGSRLTAPALGICASTGITHVKVFKPLTVALLSTGDELVEPGVALQPGQIYNSNRPMLVELLRQAGFEVVDMGQVADNHQATRDALITASEQADAILTMGGVSVGEEDHVKNAIDELGSLNLWRIRIRPGKPFAAGRVGQTPIFGLPGNPMSALVTFSLLARPCLMYLQGAEYKQALRIPVETSVVRAAQSRDEYMRVELHAGVAHRLVNQSSGVLSSALNADGLLHLPADVEIKAGERYDFIPFCSLLTS
ncbi:MULTISPECIES: gephyrin-like molybdotransferase Glp [unclassified Marinobacterium]|uniref:molybdopterin molybdotransferase MoeA n=1 Tax=unclassified Marinobacterium TaxID=2644139 RepID=UPI001568EDE2|nr:MULTISPECIES: gephyrin-like molybdotransferase Glp [unclassified Marinobacterium]NRP53008.1 Molybdopterin molybdenumtransferase [Marinobacterium sp. xm-v-242]NRP77589.1 Molybdopterin molybdenumtransferase [Marinobacterium sp. xm-m-383]